MSWIVYVLAYYAVCAACFLIANKRGPQIDSVLEFFWLFFLSPLVLIFRLAKTWRPVLSGWHVYLVVAGVVLIVVGLSGCGEHDQALADSRIYCENVAIWKQTRGDYGHPAYRGQGECRGNQ